MSNLSAALTLAVKGFKVFPCSPNSKIPAKSWTDWEGRATDDTDKLLETWSANPDYNVGLACGPSGVFVLDFDSAKRPEDQSGIEAFRSTFPGRKLPPTFTVRTGSGGWHLLYEMPASPLRNSASKLAQGVDTRGEGGYIIGPGSVVNGNTYVVTSNVDLAPLPDWLVEELKDKPMERRQATPKGDSTVYALAALRNECTALANMTEGGRNHQANRAAWNVSRFVAKGELDETHAKDELMKAAISCGLPVREAAAALASGMTRGMEYYYVG